VRARASGRPLVVRNERARRVARDDRIQAESSSARGTAPHDYESVEAHGSQHSAQRDLDLWQQADAERGSVGASAALYP
jgi:hypothetical protein